MADYFVNDDSATPGSPWNSWATAAHTLKAIIDAPTTFSAGDRIIIGSDHVDTATYGSANYTFYFPTSGVPVQIISSVVGSGSTIDYVASATNQIDNNAAGAYSLILDGSVALYGVRIRAGYNIQLSPSSTEVFYAENCTFAPGAGRMLAMYGGSSTAYSRAVLKNCAVDLTLDSTTERTNTVLHAAGQHGRWEIYGMTFTNPGYRSGTIITAASAVNHFLKVSGADFSGFDGVGATVCEVMDLASTIGSIELNNCKLYAAPTLANLFSGAPYPAGWASVVNCGTADDPSMIATADHFGSMISTVANYRSAGASVEDVANVSWAVTTTANCGRGRIWYSPWIYGTVASTGEKTFTVAIANDSADLLESEAWLEVEGLGTSESPLYSFADDQCDIDTTGSAQTDDTTSVWTVGSGTLTYRQFLAASLTIGETGLYRARVAVAKASWDQTTHKLHIDPKVVVS